MSSLEEREILIQQRQAEKYINGVRLVVLAILTAALVAQTWGYVGPLWVPATAAMLMVLAWGCAVAAQWSLSRGFFPRYLPWGTTVTDLGFFGVGLVLELHLGGLDPRAVATSLTWGYGLLFLFILFSTLRQRPALTAFAGFGAVVAYGAILLAYFPPEPQAGTWTEQIFRMGLLLVAGLFSTFHARSLRKAFDRAATSDRLRRETDGRLKALALHFPGVLFQAEVTAAAFRLHYVSEGSRDLLGVNSRLLMAHPELFFDQAEDELGQKLRLRLGREGGYRSWVSEFRYEGPTADGGPRWLQLNVTSQHTPHGSFLVNGLVIDITDQRNAAEALRRANQAKTDFLATMSHELRTPLNAILGNADHLARLADLDDDKKAFRSLQNSAEALLGLIEDILVFSRLEAGRLTAEIRPFPWRVQLEAVLDSFRPVALDKGLTLTTRFCDGPRTIGTDALRLRQIIGNLVSNAVKYTPAGEVVVGTRIEERDGASWLMVEVSDTGIGVPQHLKDQIFEKFVQGEHGKSRSYGGLGLGLSISRSLAHLLGGSLSVESEVGKGSSFVLAIPVQLGPDDEASSPGNTASETLHQARVLLVEDNLTNQDVATRMLKRLGAEVDVASGGREALAAVSTTFYDLIFMDWQMPVMDGREATARIRALPGGQDLVIVALSGHALPGDREFLLASGFDDYLAKPVRMDDFRAALAKWVATRTAGTADR